MADEVVHESLVSYCEASDNVPEKQADDTIFLCHHIGLGKDVLKGKRVSV